MANRPRMEWMEKHPQSTWSRIRSLWKAAAPMLAFLSACSTEYVPDVSLDGHSHAIEAITEFHPLHLAPTLNSGTQPFGVVAEDTDTAPASELARQLESAVVLELTEARVFSTLTRFDPCPDLVLTGRINSFFEHYRPRLWTFLPYAETAVTLLRLRNFVSTGEASLTMMLLKPSGAKIGEYIGRSAFNETFTPTDTMPPGARLNLALSTAMDQIRDQWLNDPELKRYVDSLPARKETQGDFCR